VQRSGGHLPAGRTLAGASAQTAQLVGGGRSYVIQHAYAPRHGLLTAVAPGCTGDRSDDLAACQVRTIGVAGLDTIDALTGRTVAAAHEAWRRGKAVVLLPLVSNGNSVSIRALGPDPSGSANTRIPAYVVSGIPFYGSVPQVYVSPSTAAAQGWRTHDDIAIVRPVHVPSAAVMDRAQHALGKDIYINLEPRFRPRYSAVLLAMLGAAAIATLAGTSIAVALAMAESRADMATMAAVGASPGRRRVHAMGQAAIVAGLGTGLGVALGVLVAVATLGGSERYPTSTPFRWLAAVLLAAPMLAIAVAGLVTRSRVTLTRRIA
jgi:putative ABC transport system permease protein